MAKQQKLRFGKSFFTDKSVFTEHGYNREKHMKTPVVPSVQTGNDAIDIASEFVSGMTTPENLMATAAGTGVTKALRGIGRPRVAPKPRPIGPEVKSFTPDKVSGRAHRPPPEGLTPPPESPSVTRSATAPPSESGLYFPDRVKQVRNSYGPDLMTKARANILLRADKPKKMYESDFFRKPEPTSPEKFSFKPKGNKKQLDVTPGTFSAKNPDER